MTCGVNTTVWSGSQSLSRDFFSLDIWKVGNRVQNIRLCVSVPLNFWFLPSSMRGCRLLLLLLLLSTLGIPPLPPRNKLQHPLPPTTKTARLRRDSPIEPETLNFCLNCPDVFGEIASRRRPLVNGGKKSYREGGRRQQLTRLSSKEGRLWYG